jgi:hypothetical protein
MSPETPDPIILIVDRDHEDVGELGSGRNEEREAGSDGEEEAFHDLVT